MRTRVGYTGGTRPHPTYHALGDHTESLQVDFDPAVTSFEALLDLFWKEHNPWEGAWSRQYMAAVFYDGDAQRAVVERTRDALAKRGGTILTHVAPLERFYRAEDYHQKHALRREGSLMRVFHGYSEGQFEDSTVAARLNGLVSGYVDRAVLGAEMDRMGLDAGVRGLVERLARRAGR